MHFQAASGVTKWLSACKVILEACFLMVGHDCDEWVDEGVEVMEEEKEKEVAVKKRKEVVFQKKKVVAASKSTSTPAFNKPTAKVPTPR